MWAGLGEYESEKWGWVGTRACLGWSPGWVCSAVAVAKEPGHELAGSGGNAVRAMGLFEHIAQGPLSLGHQDSHLCGQALATEEVSRRLSHCLATRPWTS